MLAHKKNNRQEQSMLEKTEHKKRRKLEQEIRTLGSPYWKAKTLAKRTLTTITALYALNMGIGTYNLLHSNELETRKETIETATQVITEMAGDPVYNGATKLYIKTKGLFNPEFRENYETLQEQLEENEATTNDFNNKIRRVYNPLAWF